MQIVRTILERSVWLFKKVYEGHDSTDPKFHDKFGVLSCVLEFIQNALDALQKNKKQTFVRIRTVFVKFNIFENSFLTKEFKNLLPYFSSSSSKSIVDEKDILCLVMEDYNTTGILGDPSIYL